MGAKGYFVTGPLGLLTHEGENVEKTIIVTFDWEGSEAWIVGQLFADTKTHLILLNLLPAKDNLQAGDECHIFVVPKSKLSTLTKLKPVKS